MTYLVQLTTQTEADIDRIFNWFFERSPEGARRWYDAFWDSANRLKLTPMSCPIAPEAVEFREEVRQILFKTRRGRTYRTLFVIRADIVHILRVRGPGERPVKPEDVES